MFRSEGFEEDIVALYYRAKVLDRELGPWRATKRRARQDAIEAGFGEYDEWGAFYLSVPAEIEWMHENEFIKLAAANPHHAGCSLSRAPR